MIPDMKELISKANEMGYSLIRYDESKEKVDDILRARYLLVFEEQHPGIAGELKDED